MDGVDWAKVTEYFKSRPDQFIPEWSKTPDRAAANERAVKLLQECDSILDLVLDGTICQIDYHELSLKAIEAGELSPYGDMGYFFTVRQGRHVQPVFQHTAQAKDCDTTDITEYSQGEVECRRQVALAIPAIRKYLPGFENAYFTRLTSGMRTREGRHTVGDYQLQAEDVASCARFPDVIARCGFIARRGGPFHSASTPGTAMNGDNSIRFVPKDGGSYDVPYRAMVPKGLEGMLMTGKLLSMSEDFKRDQLPDNMIWGQAAGIAAAICVRRGISPRELEADVSELQDILRKNGAILEGTR
jgi:hypothetical protein